MGGANRIKISSETRVESEVMNSQNSVQLTTDATRQCMNLSISHSLTAAATALQQILIHTQLSFDDLYLISYPLE
jgi:hypothetical protein